MKISDKVGCLIRDFMYFRKFYFVSTVILSNGIENRLSFSYNLVERKWFCG